MAEEKFKQHVIQVVRYAPLLKDVQAPARSLTPHQEATRLYAEWSHVEVRFLRTLWEHLEIRPVGAPFEIYITDWGKGSISLPLVVSRKVSIDDRLTVLVHEVLHRILTQNDRYQSTPGVSRLLVAWQKYFGCSDFDTVVHIPVFAMLFALNADGVISNQQLEEHRLRHLGNAQYLEAWRLVDRLGYARILEAVRVGYGEMMLLENDLAA